MITDLGVVKPGSTIRIPFHTFDSNDPSASATATGFAATDVEIFKDGSTTQRASDSGYTATTDFDGITGTHLLIIDLADNTTAGFWSAGSEYLVQVSSITVDAATINFWAGRFRIGNEAAILNTTIATLASQTSFTLTTGPAEDDALNGCVVYIHDVASAVQGGFAVVQDYTGSTKTVTLVAGTTFTAAATDNISVFPPALQATTPGRTVLVGTAGQVDGNVTQFGGTNGTFSGGRAEVNVSHWLGTAGATPTVAGVPEVDVTHWIGTAAATPTVAGVPEVDVTHWIGTAAATPTVAGVPEVDITHLLGTAWLAPGTAGTPDVNMKLVGGQTASAAATVTFPATIASTTNITAGTLTTVTNLTNLPAITANWLTAAGTATDFGTELATAFWTDTTAGDFTVALSVGKSIMNGVTLGTGLTVATVTNQVTADMVAISGDTTAADNFETMLDGTGGQTLSLKSLTVNNSAGAAFDLTGTTSGIRVVSSAGNGLELIGNTNGFYAEATSGHACWLLSSSSSKHALFLDSASGFGVVGISFYGDASSNGTTTTLIDTARTEATTDHWKGCEIRFLSGTNKGQVRLITGFTPATDTFTFAPAVNVATATSDLYEILPAGRVDLHSILGTLSPATAGYVAPDWAQVANPTATVGLTNTTVGTVTLVGTVTTLTNLPAITANWLTAAGTAADFGTELATAIWTDTTAGDFTTALSVGKSVMNGVTLGTGLTVARCTLTDTLTTYTGNTPASGDTYAALTSAVPDTIPADGSRPNIQQAVYMILQVLIEGGISGTTWTVKKPDGTTTLFTVTLDSATTPTSKTRAT